MDNQKRVARIKNGTKILSWLAFLVFFAYSFQSNMDLDWIADPRRWKSFVRILTALSHPNLLDGAHNRAAAFKM